MQSITNKRIVRSVLFCTLLLAVVIGSYFVWSQPTKQRNNQFVVAMMSGWAPFMTINNNGDYEGFDVSVAQEIAQRMNKELVIKDMGSLAPTFIALEQESVDAVMSGLDITAARRERLTLVPYSGQDVCTFTLLLWQQIPNNITCIEDLAAQQATVCIEPGSAQEKYLDQIDGIQQKSLSKLEEMVLDVKYGKSAALLLEPRIARRLQQLEPTLVSLRVPLPKEYQTFGYGIALKKENDALREQIETAITSMQTDGTMRNIEQQWQMED